MEKIYIENNKQNNNKNFLHSKSILGTFALAIIAVIAIVIVGVNQTSYAIPEEVSSKLPDTFVTADIDVSETVNTVPPSHPVNPYRTTAEYGSLQLFCMQPSLDFVGGITYKKDAEITDYGLLYLLAKLSSDEYDKRFDGYTNQTLRKAVKNWTSQVAIWMYLNDSRVTPDSAVKNYNFAEGVQTKIIGAKILNLANDTACGVDYGYTTAGVCGDPNTITDTTAATFYDTYVKSLVNEAISNKNTPNKVLRIVKNNTISVTSDEKYYQTSQISVVGGDPDDEKNDIFNGYSIKLDSAPEGSFIVNENGNKLKESELTNMSNNSKFYIRIPIDKVNENNKTVKLSVTGSFTTLEGNYYIGKDETKEYQTVAAVETVTNNVQTGAEIPLNYTPEVPDTGLSTAQTVYFIGLIVLLSGIGIIYANVKPSESK